MALGTQLHGQQLLCEESLKADLLAPETSGLSPLGVVFDCFILLDSGLPVPREPLPSLLLLQVPQELLAPAGAARKRDTIEKVPILKRILRSPRGLS